MTITIFAETTTKELKFYIDEPWPQETEIAKDLLEQGAKYLSVDFDSKTVHFSFENAQATYTMTSYDEFSDIYSLAYQGGTFIPRKERVA